MQMPLVLNCMEILFCILLGKISIHFICWFHDIEDIAILFVQPLILCF